MMLCQAQSIGAYSLIFTSGVIFVLTGGAVIIGGQPLAKLVLWREKQFDDILRSKLLLNIKPRTATILSALGMLVLASIGYLMSGSYLGVLIGLAIGVVLPSAAMRYLAKRRIKSLEDQLVGGIQTLCSGVRAGLNLVQAMELIAREGPVPLAEEFRHLIREYEYGLPLDEAMENAATRIGSGDFRLLFAALQTHRERGGDLGETLDRIAESIREIQRLEARVETLTAEGRATARWLGAMPVIVLLILNFVVDDSAIKILFSDPLGKVIILVIILLNVVGFLWIRRIVSLDI